MADARYDDFDAIEVLDEVDSTNEELMKRARAGAPEGTALRARVQQSGSSNPRCRTGCYRAFPWHAALAWQTP